MTLFGYFRTSKEVLTLIISAAMLLSMFPLGALTAAAQVAFEPLQLTSICRIDDGGLRFRVQNLNDEAITVTYEVVGTSDSDTVEVAAAGDGVIKYDGATDGANYTFFDTVEQTGNGTTKISYNVDGTDYETTKAANNSVCPEPEVDKDESTIVVTEDTSAGYGQMGWLFNRDVNTQTEFEFNNDEASLGDGALYVAPIDGNINGDDDKFIGEYFTGNMLVEDFDSLTYDFQIAGNGTAGDANEFYTNLHANFPGNENAYGDCKFDYIPSTGTPGSFETFSFSADDTPDRVRGTGCPATLADMPEDSTIFFFAINVGDTSNNDDGLAGYYDQVVLETATEITTFDFEPIPDTTDPTITVKDNAILCEGEGYEKVSFKLFDAGNIDKLILNGVEKDLSNNKYSDFNNVTVGKFGAVEGINVLQVFDEAGNMTELTFTLCGDPSTAPTATIKEDEGFTVTCEAGYETISFKLFDEDQIDRVVINGEEKDLSNNKWSDVNYIEPGKFGAVEGENTMIVYDVLGNNATFTPVLFTSHDSVLIAQLMVSIVSSSSVYSAVNSYSPLSV
jgi:hypothetical protein